MERYKLAPIEIFILDDKNDIAAKVKRHDKDEAIVTINQLVNAAQWRQLGCSIQDALDAVEAADGQL